MRVSTIIIPVLLVSPVILAGCGQSPTAFKTPVDLRIAEGTTILERAHIVIDSERTTLVDGKEVMVRYEGFRDVEYALVNRKGP